MENHIFQIKQFQQVHHTYQTFDKLLKTVDGLLPG